MTTTKTNFKIGDKVIVKLPAHVHGGRMERGVFSGIGPSGKYAQVRFPHMAAYLMVLLAEIKAA